MQIYLIDITLCISAKLHGLICGSAVSKEDEARAHTVATSNIHHTTCVK